MDSEANISVRVSTVRFIVEPVSRTDYRNLLFKASPNGNRRAAKCRLPSRAAVRPAHADLSHNSSNLYLHYFLINFFFFVQYCYVIESLMFLRSHDVSEVEIRFHELSPAHVYYHGATLATRNCGNPECTRLRAVRQIFIIFLLSIYLSILAGIESWIEIRHAGDALRGDYYLELRAAGDLAKRRRTVRDVRPKKQQQR